MCQELPCFNRTQSHVTAKSTKSWFADNGIQLFPNWPSNFPNLNAIENCWNLMKAKVTAHRPRSEEDLKEILKRVWVTEITPETLVKSMPACIASVLRNRGHPTKY